MLSGRLRALRVVVGALWATPGTTESVLHLRVLPTDVDLNVHLTNSRYAQWMDLGRIDLLARNRRFLRMLRTGHAPVLVGLSIDFRRELPLGARVTLRTRMVAQDRKAVVIRQRFELDGAVAAEGRVRLLLVKDGRVVEPEMLQDLLAPDPSDDVEDQVQGSRPRAVQ